MLTDPSRPIVRRLTHLVLAILVVAGLAPLGLPSYGAGSRVVAQSAPGCVVGRNLVTNGSFESPGTNLNDPTVSYYPDGWTGLTRVRGSLDDILGIPNTIPYSGQIYLSSFTSLSQSVPTAGLSGATVALSYIFYPGLNLEGLAVQLGDTPIAPVYTSSYVYYTEVTLGPDVPDFSLLRFQQLGGASIVFDRVVLTVLSCPANTPPSVTGLDGAYTTTAEVAVADTFTVSDAQTSASGLTVSVDQGEHGIATVWGTGTIRRLTYRPDPGFTGTDTLSLTVSDGRLSTSYPITVTVRSGQPVITVNGGPQDGASYTTGTVPAAPTCAARDSRGVTIACTVTGYAMGAGTHTLTFRAVDRFGTEATITRTYTVTGQPATATPTRPVRPPRTPTSPTATPPVVIPPTLVVTPPTPVVTPPPVVPTPRPTRPPRR